MGNLIYIVASLAKTSTTRTFFLNFKQRKKNSAIMKTIHKKVKTIKPSTIKKIPVGSGSLSRSKIIIIPAGTFITNSLQESGFNNNNNNITIREVRNSHFTNSDSGSESDSNNSVELNKSNYSRISPKTRSLLAVSNLTKEEKLQRRKMKNRLAAQHCRDKRRIKMEQMEMEIQILKEKNRNLESISEELKIENDILTSKNEILRSFGLKTTTEIIQENTEPLLFQPQQEVSIMKNECPLSPQNNENFDYDGDDFLNGLNGIQQNIDFLEQITDEDITFQSDFSNIFDAKWPWEKDLEELFIPDL